MPSTVTSSALSARLSMAPFSSNATLPLNPAGLLLTGASLVLGASSSVLDAVLGLLPRALLILLGVLVITWALAYNEQMSFIRRSGAVAVTSSVWPLTSLPSAVLDSTRLLGIRWTIGTDWIWNGKFSKYAGLGSDIICVSSVMASQPSYFVANKDSLRQMNIDRTTFLKPTAIYQVLKLFGMNLIVVEGDEWKRHRSIVKGSFSNDAYPLVWKRTRAIVQEMVKEEGWSGLAPGTRVDLPHIHSLTLRIALVVIAEAGFGMSLPWSDKAPAAVQLAKGTSIYDGADHSASDDNWGGWRGKTKFTVQEALRTVACNTLLRIALPKPLFWLPIKKLWKVDRAFKQLEAYLVEMITVRRARIVAGCDWEEVSIEETDASLASEKLVERVERKDLFGALIRSSLQGDAQGLTLSDSEVVGGAFINLIAGHETTANTLAFTLANLSLHPEYQDRILDEIRAIEARIGGEITFENYNELKFTFACYNESIRQFPPVAMIPKVAVKDATLVANSIPGAADGVEDGPSVVCIPSGALVYEDIAGLHYNPAYYPEPLKYDPSRFLGDKWDKDAFLPFAAGPRACIGRRFSEVEAVCAIVHIVKIFRLHPSVRTGESIDQTKERILAAKTVITLTPVDCPLVFEKR